MTGAVRDRPKLDLSSHFRVICAVLSLGVIFRYVRLKYFVPAASPPEVLARCRREESVYRTFSFRDMYEVDHSGRLCHANNLASQSCSCHDRIFLFEVSLEFEFLVQFLYPIRRYQVCFVLRLAYLYPSASCNLRGSAVLGHIGARMFQVQCRILLSTLLLHIPLPQHIPHAPVPHIAPQRDPHRSRHEVSHEATPALFAISVGDEEVVDLLEREIVSLRIAEVDKGDEGEVRAHKDEVGLPF